jgi:hypothetical protein
MEVDKQPETESNGRIFKQPETESNGRRYTAGER